MVDAGIDDILIVTGGNHAGDFLRLLRNGKEFGLRRVNYAYQEGEGGIADALGLAEDFADGGSLCVILGDNIFGAPIREAVESYRAGPEGAMVLLKEVDDPQRFGVAELDGDRIVSIVEKPSQPKSNLAVTGCYFYDGRVFDIVNGLSPSDRGELEITDVNNRYIKWGALRHHVVDGWWTDAGTIPSLYRATRLVAETEDQPVLRLPEITAASEESPS
jgi:glucose-1-phosphate thymidylyltransferase